MLFRSSLWRVALCAADESQLRVLPIFRHDDGRSLGPTARYLWDRLLGEERMELGERLDGGEAQAAYEASLGLAQRLGQDLFLQLLQEHRRRLDRDREKTEFALTRRRTAIGRIGLPAVRQHRLSDLDLVASALRSAQAKRENVVPELDAIAIVRVESIP